MASGVNDLKKIILLFSAIVTLNQVGFASCLDPVREEIAETQRVSFFNRIPEKMRTQFFKGAAKAVKVSANTYFSPYFIIADSSFTATRSLGKTLNLFRNGGNFTLQKQQTAISWFASDLTGLVTRQVPPFLGFVTLYHFGYHYTDLATITYKSEMDPYVLNEGALKEKEIAVTITSKELHRPAIVVQINPFSKDANKTKTHHFPIYTDNIDETFASLGRLRKYGRIRILQIETHGSPGYMDFRAEDSTSVGENALPALLFTEKLKYFHYFTSKWPSDLFAPDAQIIIRSCNVAQGNEGDNFCKSFGGVILQHGGTVIASTKSYTYFQDQEAIKAHSIKALDKYPLEIIKSEFKPENLLLYAYVLYINNPITNNEPKIKTYKIPVPP